MSTSIKEKLLHIAANREKVLAFDIKGTLSADLNGLISIEEY